jgi:spore maturation protein CgeB
LFHWIATTDPQSVPKYHRTGCNNVIQTQWAFNHFLYKKIEGPSDHTVSFIGQAHSNRRSIVAGAARKGIDIECRGKGWPGGRLSQDEMVEWFSHSKINLNFSGSSPGLHLKPFGKVFLNRRADNTFHPNSPAVTAANLTGLFQKKRAQIKGRNFEIPGSGGFLLTEYAEGIEEYFQPGKEIAIFHSAEELVDVAGYYLTHEDERTTICLAGYRRALRDHTFENRFTDIFRKMGFTL